MTFLDEKAINQLDSIKLESVFSSPDGYKRYGWFSTSIMSHYSILQKMVEEDRQPDGSLMYSHLQRQDFKKATDIGIEHGNMFVQLPFCAKSGISAIYLNQSLGEYQLIRMRLWLEYFKLYNCQYAISYFNGMNAVEIEDYHQMDELFRDLNVYDDEKILNLIQTHDPLHFRKIN